MISPTSRTDCWRCEHPYAWHRPLDTLDLDPLNPSATLFRCYGHDPAVDGPRRGCMPDCANHDPDWVPPLAPRNATEAEQNIARAWADRHTFQSPAAAEMEYAHALAILVFGNARPPRKNGGTR